MKTDNETLLLENILKNIIEVNEMEYDMLEEIFEHQLALQVRMGSDTHSQEFCNTMSLALMVETGEFIQETKWKPWKKSAVFNKEAAKEELIDALHFWTNLALFLDMTPQEVHELYLKKNKVNHERQDGGY